MDQTRHQTDLVCSQATDVDAMADDTDTQSLASPRPKSGLRSRDSFEETHRPAPPSHHHHARGSGTARRPQTLAAAAAANSSMSALEELPSREAAALRSADPAGYDPGVESGMESGASTYDGDVSSAPGGHSVKGHKTAPHMPPPSHPASATVPPGSRDSSDGKGAMPGSSLSRMSIATEDDSTDVAGAGVVNAVAAYNAGVLAGKGKGPSKSSSHPPAPHGFLARMDPQELQAKMREAIEDKAGQRSVRACGPYQGELAC